MDVVGSLICMAKFPLAVHEQTTPLSTYNPLATQWAAPMLFFFEKPQNNIATDGITY